MLSYQHSYHAGNLADVHKHALLSWVLNYLTQKPKPVSYIETHAGRGDYDLSDAASLKTNEAALGVGTALGSFETDHPYALAVRKLREKNNPFFYPGSPRLATHFLRDGDKVHLCELHPGEFSALRASMSRFNARCYNKEGFGMAHALCPPTPRRGLVVIDPSYEIKTDYQKIPGHISKITKAWNVGIVFLWYPVLKGGTHKDMIGPLCATYPNALKHEVSFAPAKKGHRMIGSGIFVINPPYGLEKETGTIDCIFEAM